MSCQKTTKKTFGVFKGSNLSEDFIPFFRNERFPRHRQNASVMVLILMFSKPVSGYCLCNYEPRKRQRKTIQFHATDNDNNSNFKLDDTTFSSNFIQPFPQFHVAPMQGYTNAPLRQLFRFLSDDAKLWTEMEKVQDLLNADSSALERRFGNPHKNTHAENENIVLQLGGSHVEDLTSCIRKLSNKGYQFQEINLNCGCPSIESGGATDYGASLMKRPQLTHDLLKAMRKTVIEDGSEISLKCRIAVVESPDDVICNSAISDQQYEYLYNYISLAEQAGISHVVLHARAAVLSGLSPTKNRQVPPLDYSIVERIAHDFKDSSLRVTMNGGITNLACLEHLIMNTGLKHRHKSDQKIIQSQDQQVELNGRGISSYMAGRWMLRRPLDLAFVHPQTIKSKMKYSSSFLEGETSGIGERIEAAKHAVEQYSEYVKQNLYSLSSPSRNGINKAGTPSLADLCLPLFLIIEQCREEYEHETIYNDDGTNDSNYSNSDCYYLREEDLESIYDILYDTTEWLQDVIPGAKKKKKKKRDVVSYDMNFKKLTSCLKSLVGTKIANKWKRNRAEL